MGRHNFLCMCKAGRHLHELGLHFRQVPFDPFGQELGNLFSSIWRPGCRDKPLNMFCSIWRLPANFVNVSCCPEVSSDRGSESLSRWDGSVIIANVERWLSIIWSAKQA